jgi:hypothetical protein
MKLFCFVTSMFVFGFAGAQQSPELLPGTSTIRPEFAPQPLVSPARNTAPSDSFQSPRELAELVRAQTEAIRVLSAKVDALDDRLRRIESKLR